MGRGGFACQQWDGGIGKGKEREETTLVARSRVAGLGLEAVIYVKCYCRFSQLNDALVISGEPMLLVKKF